MQTAKLVDHWDGKALALGKHDSTDALKKKIEHLKEKQEKERRKIGLSNRTKAGVSEELRLAVDELKTMQGIYSTVRAEFKASVESVARRRQAWRAQLKTLQKIVAKNFDIYMQLKGFAGTVKFNHEEQTLQLRTQTDNSNAQTQCSDVRQLSGGERSYTTLCLLLALGLAVCCALAFTE